VILDSFFVSGHLSGIVVYRPFVLRLIILIKKVLPIVIGILLAFSMHAKAETNIKISDADGITFEVIPQLVSDTNIIDGEVRISLIGGDLVKVSGEPMVPVMVVTVAVPHGSNPTVRVEQRVPGRTFAGRLPIYIPDEIEATFPSITDFSFENQVLGSIQESAIGDVKVIRIPIYPAIYNQASGQIELAQRIKIRVDFHAGKQIASGKLVKLNRLAQLVLINPAQTRNWRTASTSGFSEPSWMSGDIYRFPIEREGIYRLRYEDLVNKGVFIPAGGIPSNQLRLYGNGGGTLPEDSRDPTQLGLLECAIYIEDGGDGSFDAGDWMLFYGKGAGGWTLTSEDTWNYQVHPYSTVNYYWLNIDHSPNGNGLRMSIIDESAEADTSVNSAPTRIYHGPDKFIFGFVTFIGSGRRWYSDTYDGISRFNYNVTLESVDTSITAIMTTRLVSSNSISGPRPHVEFRFNDEFIDDFLPGSHASQFGGIEAFSIPGHILNSGYNTATFQQTNSNVTSMFDWLDLRYHTRLDHSVIFEAIPYNGAVRYTFSDMNPFIFDITDHNQVSYLKSQSLTINQDRSPVGRYAVLPESRFLSVPVRFEEYFPPEADLTDLWAASNRANVILITADAYWDVLEPLIEHYGRQDPPLTGVRVRLSEVLNRFSAGLMDPVAIRNMLLYAQENWSKAPDYVLFCGDGDYNYRDIGRSKSTNFLPPFEIESNGQCTDDWFVDFSPEDQRVLPEMIHGRFTATTRYEMESMVNKTIDYVDNPEFGLWRNTITMVADDEFGEASNREKHILQQEVHVNSNLPHTLDFRKIYLMEYERTIGREKTGAGDDLVKAINKGTLLVNYMGHGNATLWAHEKVFVLSRDLPRINPSRRLPVYVAFTCDWAYWDNASTQSFPEQLLSMRDGGAIGIIASTRLTYSGQNNELAREYFLSQFNDEYVTIGEALAVAKHISNSYLNATYHLLGDPTLHLANPRLKGTLTIPEPYPLKPLALTALEGRIHGLDGQFDPDFNGVLEFLVRDTDIKKLYIIEYYNSRGDLIEIPIRYKTNGIPVYRGKFSVESGQIKGNIIVPTDVTLGGEFGRVFAYFHNDVMDGIVALDSVVTATQAAPGEDNTAPEIEVLFDHRGYRSGDKIGKTPLLIVDVTDSSGINLTGKMGHGISVSIDGGRQISLIDDFNYELNSYQSGSLQHRIGPLTSGPHDLEIIAWDSYNNIGIKELKINVVDDEGGLTLAHVLNYPNPFKSSTVLTFTVDRPVDYKIKIFTVDGRRIWDYRGRASDAGIESKAVWDGRDSAGRQVGNGVYLYQVNAWDENGGNAKGLGRIAYVR